MHIQEASKNLSKFFFEWVEKLNILDTKKLTQIRYFFFNINKISNINPLNTNPTKWSNTLKQCVSNLPNCEIDHFVKLALKGLNT